MLHIYLQLGFQVQIYYQALCSHTVEHFNAKLNKQEAGRSPN